MKSYSKNIATLTWLPVNGEPDISNWELIISDKNNNELECKGKGFEQLFNVFETEFDKDRVNVIYIRDIRWFVEVLRNRIDLSDNDVKFFAVPDSKGGCSYSFLHFNFKNIELRDWKRFFPDLKDGRDFLKAMKYCMKLFKPKDKYMSIRNNFNTTYAAEAWNYIKNKFYLTSSNKTICKTLCPKTIEEFEELDSLNKASYYYVNQNLIGDVIENVYSWDISSSHIGFLARKKFPSTEFKKTKNGEESLEIIKNKSYCWFGRVAFWGLKWKTPFKTDLSKFDFWWEDDERKCCSMLVTDLDLSYFDKIFTWDKRCICEIFYSKYSYIKDTNCHDMIYNLYEWKEEAKKKEIFKDIFKPMTEFPYGQSIKTAYYENGVVYNEVKDSFDFKHNGELTEESFKKVQKTLSEDRGLPMQFGLWIVAYSRLELVEIMSRVGFENVVYVDTDCIKFIGEGGNKIIEERNKEIDQEFNEFYKAKLTKFNSKLGRWKFEGKFKRFKTIGVKQYMVENENGEIEVTCTGAEKENLNKFFENKANPFLWFKKNMLADDIYVSKRLVGKHLVEFTYHQSIPKDLQRLMKNKFTVL